MKPISRFYLLVARHFVRHGTCCAALQFAPAFDCLERHLRVPRDVEIRVLLY
jgi:hypothetical protein